MTAPEIRRWSVEAQVDPKTIARFLRGEPVRPSSEERIRAAAKRLKIRTGRNGR